MCCLLGGCSGIVCRPRTIFSVVVLLTMNLGSVWQVAVWSNRLIICSYIVIFLGLSGILFIDGWAFLWSSLYQFSYSGGIAKVRRSILQVIWFATVWEIWKERNNILSKDKECSIIQVVDKIKSLAFMWLKAKFSTLPFNYHGWWLSPFTMMGIC